MFTKNEALLEELASSMQKKCGTRLSEVVKQLNHLHRGIILTGNANENEPFSLYLQQKQNDSTVLTPAGCTPNTE